MIQKEIHIYWQGPFSYEEAVDKFTDEDTILWALSNLWNTSSLWFQHIVVYWHGSPTNFIRTNTTTPLQV